MMRSLMLASVLTAGCGYVGDPGALDVTNWYVDSVVGGTADCEAPGAPVNGHGACASLAAVWRRIGPQCDPARLVAPVVHLHGDFSSESTIFAHSACVYPTLVGERLYAAPDGTPYPSGTVSAYTAWDGAAHQEGVATVTLTDGTLLDLNTYATARGYWLEVTTGANAGLGVPVGDVRGPGTFATSSGSVVGGYSADEPAAGDAVRVYRLTRLATDTGTYVEWSGGPMIVQNVEMGNAQHSVSVSNLNGAVNGLELDACLVHGSDVFQGAWLFEYGSVHTAGLRVYGRLVTSASTYDGLQARDDGELELSDNTLVTTNGIWVGGRDGPGYAQISGATCVSSPAVPALRVDDGQLVRLSAPWWVRASVPWTIAADVHPGSTVLYDPGFEPVCLGTCSAAPWVVGGASFSMLPVSNGGAAVYENN